MKKINTLSLWCLCTMGALVTGCTKADQQIKTPIDASIQSTETVVVGDKDVDVEFKIILSQKLDEDVVIRVVPKGDVEAINLPVSEFLFLTYAGEGKDYISSEKEKTGKVTFKASAFPQITSVATVELALESDDIELSEDSKVTIVASRKQPTPPAPITASIEAGQNEVEVTDTDVNVDFTVTLSEPLTNDAVFNLKATSESDVPNGYELNNQSLTIDAGQTTGVGILTFKAAAFTCEHIVVEVTVTAATEAEIVMSQPSVIITAKKAVQ